jgi:heme/copper-type cytochrome/quinol oxidase subunit 2
VVPPSGSGPGSSFRGLAFAGAAVALVPASTNLELTTPLLWTMLAISVAGAIVTFAFLVYAVWKFRDPAARRRRYG